MPYIKQEARQVLDPIIGQFGGIVGGKWEGALNYIVTKLCLLYIRGDGGVSYSRIASAIGTLEAAKLELYRRFAVPYEEEKRALAGDVYGTDTRNI